MRDKADRKIKRLCVNICAASCLILAINIALKAQNAPRTRSNVLILYADDWRHDTLGVAGHPVVKTPNLDRLAAEGVRFTRAHVTTSICGVSRASLFTGQWMSRHGNPAFEMFRTPWSETFPGLLRDNGYQKVNEILTTDQQGKLKELRKQQKAQGGANKPAEPKPAQKP